MKKDDLVKLREPLDRRWRVQSTRDGKAICIPYVDARAVQELLDRVCGASDWQNTYDPETGAASIGILVDGDWMWKSDVGTDSKVEKEKGKASDAFKRAAVLWGINREMYQLGEVVLPMSGKYAATKQGTALITGRQLTDYINGLNTECSMMMQIYKANEQFIKTTCYDEFKKVYDLFQAKTKKEK